MLQENIKLRDKPAWEGPSRRVLHSRVEMHMSYRLHAASGDAAAVVPGTHTQVLWRLTAPRSSWNWKKRQPG